MIHVDRPCDFARWANADSWLLDETAFILLGREPPPREWLLPDSPKTRADELRTYMVPHDYEKIERWLIDSIGDGTLVIAQGGDGAVWTTPGAVLRWAKLEGFGMPLELVRLIEQVAQQSTSPPSDIQDAASEAGRQAAILQHADRNRLYSDVLAEVRKLWENGDPRLHSDMAKFFGDKHPSLSLSTLRKNLADLARAMERQDLIKGLNKKG